MRGFIVKRCQTLIGAEVYICSVILNTHFDSAQCAAFVNYRFYKDTSTPLSVWHL